MKSEGFPLVGHLPLVLLRLLPQVARFINIFPYYFNGLVSDLGFWSTRFRLNRRRELPGRTVTIAYWERVFVIYFNKIASICPCPKLLSGSHRKWHSVNKFITNCAVKKLNKSRCVSTVVTTPSPEVIYENFCFLRWRLDYFWSSCLWFDAVHRTICEHQLERGKDQASKLHAFSFVTRLDQVKQVRSSVKHRKRRQLTTFVSTLFECDNACFSLRRDSKCFYAGSSIYV